jgi:hypothetical protein
MMKHCTGTGGGVIVFDYLDCSVRAVPGPLVSLAKARQGKYRRPPVTADGVPDHWFRVMLALHQEKVAREMPEGEAANRSLDEARWARVMALALDPSLDVAASCELARDADAFFTAAARGLLRVILDGERELMNDLFAFSDAARRVIACEGELREGHRTEMQSQAELPHLPVYLDSLVGQPYPKEIRDLCAVIQRQAQMLGKPPTQRKVREEFGELPPYRHRNYREEKNFSRFLKTAGFQWLPRARDQKRVVR